jgi:hypothetical protein
MILCYFYVLCLYLSCSGVVQQDHKVVPSLVFWGTSILISISSCTNLQSYGKSKRFSFPVSSSMFTFVWFLEWGRVSWNPSVMLTYITLMLKDADRFFFLFSFLSLCTYCSKGFHAGISIDVYNYSLLLLRTVFSLIYPIINWIIYCFAV